KNPVMQSQMQPITRSKDCQDLSGCFIARCGAALLLPYSLRILGIGLAEVVGHLLDLVLCPERAAADHAVERALPRAAILPLVHPHRRRVALEALRDEDILARRVGEAD